MADSTIDIILRAIKKGTGSKDVQKDLQGLKSGFAGAVEQITGFNVQTLAAGGVIAGIAAGVKKATDNWVKYNDEIRAGVSLTGDTYENTSRLVQISDDMGISYEKLKTIMQGANRQGFQPTLENIAALSDEYLALEPGLSRNELLMSKLGRAGMEYAEVLKLGSDRILEMAGAVNEGQIATEQSAAETFEYKMQLDDLDDTFVSLSNQIGKVVVPILIRWLNKMSEGITVAQKLASWNSDLSGVVKEHELAVRGSAESYDAYVQEMIRSIEVAGILREEETNNAMVYYQRSGDLSYLNAVMQTYGYKLEFATEREIAFYQAVQNGTIEVQKYDEAVNGAAGATGDLGGSIGDVFSNANDAKTVMQELTKELLFNKAAAGLDAGAALELARSMGLVQEDTYSAMEGLDQLRKKYDSNKDGAIDAAEAANGYTKEVGGLAAMIEMLKDKSVTVRKTIIEEYIRTSSRGETGGWGDNQEQERAYGGPVSMGRGYLVGEYGPEWFQPKQNGNVIPNSQLGSGQPLIGNVTIQAGPGTDGRKVAADFVTELGRLYRQARNSGAGFIGA